MKDTLTVNSDEESSDEEQAEEQSSLEIDIIVPEGCNAGDLLMVGTPDGRQVEVVVPEGYSVGETFAATTPR